MRKYDVRFCDCGRVHFIENKVLGEICDKQEKEILFICNHCGATSRIGIEDYMDGKAWYSMYVNDTKIEDTSRIGLVIASRGEQIRMQTGGEATMLVSSEFIDWETKKPDDVSEADWDKKRRTVHTQHTINWIKDEDKLDALSCYGVDIHWAGTKYEKEFNK